MWNGDSNSDAGSIEPTAIPKPVRCDITKLTIGRVDAFLLSQIDGSSSVDDLASLAGLPVAEACASVARLLTLGVIRVPGLRRTKAPPPRRSSTSTARQTVSPPRKTKAPSARRSHHAIPRETVAPGSLASPDSVGRFSVDVFSTPRTRRAERQKSLVARSVSPSPELRPKPAKKPTIAPPKKPTIAPPKKPTIAPPKKPTIAPPKKPTVAPPPPEAKRPRIRVPSGGFAAVIGKVRVAKTQIPPKMRASDEEPTESSSDDEEANRHARLFVGAAERELSNGNVVAAAAQLKLALSCCDTPEIRKAYEAVEEQAKERRYDQKLAVAQAAEKESRWADAADAYAKAHATTPSARVAERLAHALRQANGDLRLAAKMAEEAVQGEPQNGSFRITLGEVYADAGLELRAQAEARRALELLPSDPRAQALASRVAKRGR